MQTVKTSLTLIICVALLSACGLSGPLYLPDDKPDSKPAPAQPSTTETGEAEKEQDAQNKKSTDH